jgi:two-component system cell cycle sensor histidine kinase/response regulator CckA
MSSHRILVVDDDEIVRKGLALNLEREGFEVEMAGHGEEALAIVENKPFDLILCDVVMGDVDGIEVLRRMQRKLPDVSVVMITGHGSISNALDALRNGASDYIQKPATPDEVIHRIRSVLDASRLRRTLQAERRKAEQRKLEVHDQLIRAERMASLGMLAEGAADDLAQILTPIGEDVEALRKKVVAGGDECRLLDEIEAASNKASAVIQDLQIIGKGGRFEKRPVDINVVVREWLSTDQCEDLKMRYPRTRLQTSLGVGLPRISGSAAQLSKVVANMVINAFESLPNGGIVTVTTGSEPVMQPVGRYGTGQPGEYVILSVHDSGGGMLPEDVERVFEPFYPRKKMGRHVLSGLGLTLVYRVVADHEGFIDVETAQGRGTTFRIYLPLPMSTIADTLDLKADYTGSETVLVVDDYEAHRNAAAEVLRALGYTVVTACSGREAVEMFRATMDDNEGEGIDLVVIDLVLGDEFDGVDTYKNLLEICPDQKAIMVSGFSDINRIVEARKLGITHCIQKPYSADSLGRAVRSELDGD